MKMDAYRVAMVTLVIFNCILLAFSKPNTAEDSEVPSDLRTALLNRILRGQYERELQNLIELEKQIQVQLSALQDRKRELEVRKRGPIQCLVNAVSCWKKK